MQPPSIDIILNILINQMKKKQGNAVPITGETTPSDFNWDDGYFQNYLDSIDTELNKQLALNDRFHWTIIKSEPGTDRPFFTVYLAKTLTELAMALDGAVSYQPY